MAKVQYKNGVTSVVLRIFLPDTTSTTGAGKTGLTSASTGLIVSTIADNEATATTYTVAGSTIETITTLGTFAAPTSTKCRFKEVDATNFPGVYEVQIADARWAVSSARSLVVSVLGATGIPPTFAEVQLSAVDPNDSVRGGMTALPNVAAGANGGLPTGDASGRVDLGKILGTASQGTAGYVGLDWGHVNAPTTTVNLTNTSISVLQQVASVSGAVASVTGNVGGNVVGSVGSVTGLTTTTIASAVWNEVLTGATHNVTNSAGKLLRSATPGLDAVIYPASGTVTLQSATSTTATLDTLASGSNDAYQWDVLNILSGTGAGQSRIITGYAGSTRQATITPAWTTTPDNTSTFDITPTASVQVVSYASGQDPATLVWAAATRTLTALGSGVITSATFAAGAIDAAAIATDAFGALELAAGAATEIATAVRDISNASPATGSLGAAVNAAGGGGLDAAGVRAAVGLASANLDTQLDTVAGYIDTEVGTLQTTATAIKAKTDNLPASPAATTDIPTAAQNADKVLGRNVAGGSDGGRTVKEALYFLRNKFAIVGGTLTVYATDDSTPAWTATVTTAAGDPLTGSDPA